jgi:TRAP transporter TAXI family solute receptor
MEEFYMTFVASKKIAGSAAAVLAGAVIAAGTAQAQSIGIGSTKGGATAQVTAGISKVVSAHSGSQMRPQPMGGTQQYIPVVNAGELAFGVSNAMQAYMAFTGTGLSAGKKYPNLRVAARLMTFRTGVFVTTKSGITSIAGLKGKRVPSKFSASPLFRYLVGATLANAGLGWGDVKMIPQTALRQHWQAFSQGKIDVAYGAVGSGILRKINAAVGGIRFLPLATDAASSARMLKVAPQTYIKAVKPAKPFAGILAPTNILHFDYLLWTHKGVPAKTVTAVLKALYENEKELHSASPLWRSHRSKNMGTPYGAAMPYHPAAIAYYKKIGVWKGK